MNTDIRTLSPRPLWEHFADLNAVPRPSKHEARAIAFIEQFGKSLGLPVKTDRTGNVLITKPATAGLEQRPTVALQSHLDMVHQKNSGTDFDFGSQGIRMLLEEDWVAAQGTTLGADNGIGVAAIMAVLASRDIPHPPLEALFTVDEETGMTGAKGLQGGVLKAAYLLNLDTEDDRELTIGCAGGVDVQASMRYASEAVPAGHELLKVALTGLSGGHSGMEIHLGRANANKLMNRFLYGASNLFDARICEIDGGGLRNAIPRESTAVIAVSAASVEAFRGFVHRKQERFEVEYRVTDPQLSLSCSSAAGPQRVLEWDFQGRLLRVLYALADGIYRMSPDVDALVQTSNNVARVLVRGGELSVQCLTRGSVDSEKMDLATALRCTLELMGAEVEFLGEYPGWTPRPDSGIVTLMSGLYRELFGEAPIVNACHAGLECGILGTNYPGVEMVSFGPNIRGAHSPDERVQVSSVQKFWNFLTRTLGAL